MRRVSERAAGIVATVLAWAAAGALLYLLRFGGLTNAPQMQHVDFTGVDFSQPFLMLVLGGGLLGLGVAMLDPLLNSERVRRLPYGRVILVHAFAMMALLVSVMLAVFSVTLLRDGSFSVAALFARMTNPFVAVVLTWTAGVAAVFAFVRQVDRKFGPGNLRKMLSGHYFRPRVERRIFMFLDLQDSTAHAERLGHIRYSQMIQDCFRDLAVVTTDGAEVYQYVGDEAVLCWQEERGLRGGACLSAYFRFMDQLEARRSTYEATYGIVPVFKAGLNHGEVTVAEVGEIKREIAFHGDVLNTAARIQGRCNEFGRRLLVSQRLREALGSSTPYRFESLGALTLRGRAAQVAVFAVERTAPTS